MMNYNNKSKCLLNSSMILNKIYYIKIKQIKKEILKRSKIILVFNNYIIQIKIFNNLFQLIKPKF